MKSEHFPTPYTKINSKWIKDLNVRRETVNLLEENMGRTLDGTNQSKILCDPPPRLMEINTRVKKWDLIKLKSFCTAKEKINKIKKQSSEQEKTIANKTTDKGLSPKYTSISCSSIPEKQPNQKMDRRPKQLFLQRRHTTGE